MDKYMNIDDVVEFLRLKKATIYHLTHMKKIPHIKLGRKLLFDKYVLHEWLMGKIVYPHKALSGRRESKNG